MAIGNVLTNILIMVYTYSQIIPICGFYDHPASIALAEPSCLRAGLFFMGAWKVGEEASLLFCRWF